MGGLFPTKMTSAFSDISFPPYFVCVTSLLCVLVAAETLPSLLLSNFLISYNATKGTWGFAQPDRVAGFFCSALKYLVWTYGERRISMLTKLKKKVQEALATEARIAHRLGFTPNIISVIGITLSFLAAVAYADALTEPLLLLVAVFLLLASGFCDTLDGIIARTYQQATPFGGFFDTVLDRYADAVVYAGIIVGGLCNTAWGLAALAGSLLVSYCRARAEAAGVKMESVGLAERAERMIILAVVSVIAYFWIDALNCGIIVLAVLANFTVLQRALHVYRWLKKKENTITV
jgi:archaetidylinositol phosphate synthase